MRTLTLTLDQLYALRRTVSLGQDVLMERYHSAGGHTFAEATLKTAREMNVVLGLISQAIDDEIEEEAG
jgi:hypothetical protein